MQTKQAKFPAVVLSWALMLILVIQSGCGRLRRDDPASLAQEDKNLVLEPVAPDHGQNLLRWLTYRPERVTPRALSGLRTDTLGDLERRKLALGFGIERPQAMDQGVYGKIGASTVFVASRKQIPDFDRLYWVMVRVLSEKYGCFIRRKFPYENQIGFECRDRRTIVMQRAITPEHVKFVGWQFDAKGRQVYMRRL